MTDVGARRRIHTFDEMTAATAVRLLELAVARLSREPVLREPPDPSDLAAAVGPIGRDPRSAEEVLGIWTEHIAPTLLPVDHPRYLAFIPGAPTPESALFDMLISAQNAYAGSWLEAAGAVQAENRVLEWLSDLVGFPSDAGGCFVQGGTIGNLSALVTARHTATTAGNPAADTVIISSHSHSSISYAVERVMGAHAHFVGVDDSGRLTSQQLEAVDPAVLERAFALVTCAGSTNLGDVDDLASAARFCRAHDLWMHVDGAYGGAGLLSRSRRALFSGIEQADSVIIDPHKWLFAPYDSCAVIYRTPEHARRAHRQEADYLDILANDPRWNPSDYGVHLSRRPRGLPLWFSLSIHGEDAYRDAVDRTFDLAASAATAVKERSYLDLIRQPQLTVVGFYRRDWAATDYEEWSRRLLKRGTAFVAPTSHRGKPCCRLAIVNPQTTAEDIESVLDSME